MKRCEECSQSSPHKTSRRHDLFVHWLRRHKKDKSHFLMLRAAIESSPLTEPATCDSCQWKQFSRKNSLSRHCRRHLKHGQNYCCNRCGKEYSTKIGLNNHIYQSKAVCDICSSVMATGSLDYHRKSHFGIALHNKGLYFCDECSYRSIKKSTLSIHLAVTHNRRKDFACDICDMKYSMKINLLRHQVNFHFEEFRLPSLARQQRRKITCDQCNIRITHPRLVYHIRSAHL